MTWTGPASFLLCILWVQWTGIAQLVDWQRQGHMSIGIWFRKATGPDIHLDGRYNQLGGPANWASRWSRISTKFILRRSDFPTWMGNVSFHLQHAGLPSIFFAAFAAIFWKVGLVTHKKRAGSHLEANHDPAMVGQQLTTQLTPGIM